MLLKVVSICPRHLAKEDSVLKLYQGIEVMLKQNKHVANGIANGTQATLQKVVLKEGEPFSNTAVYDGQSSQQVKSVLASPIKHITLKHKNPKANPQVFNLATARNIHFFRRASSSRRKDNIFHESPTNNCQS